MPSQVVLITSLRHSAVVYHPKYLWCKVRRKSFVTKRKVYKID